MDLETILTILVTLLLIGLSIAFFVIKEKRAPLTFVEFFLKDKNHRYIHILGAKRFMPEDGDSFDIFEHYIFDLSQLKFTKGGSQQGENLDLKSEFVKRSLTILSQKLGCPLKFDRSKKDTDNEDSDDENNGVLSVYRIKAMQSDTEVLEGMVPNRLVFMEHGSKRDHFAMMIYKNDEELERHYMRGMSDYFFKMLYIRDKEWLCFLYRKEETFTSGMALCIINYNTGELIFDDFVRNGKGGVGFYLFSIP